MARASTSAELLEGVFQHALDAIVLIDDEGRYVTVNPAMCELVGRSRDELLSLRTGHLSAGAPGELEAWWRTFFDQGFAEGEFPVRHSSGRILQVEFRAVANVLPGSHLAILRDVTERRRAEEELRDQEAHLALLLDQVPAGIWTVDHDLVFTSTSGRILRALGLRVGSLTGTSLTELGERVALPELVVAAHHEALAGHRWSGTFEWLRRTWQCEVEPLHRGRETVGAVGLAVDVTETVQTKQQLEETVAELRLVDREREHLLERLLRVEHEERSRIARELHDDLGQVLVSASLYARWFADRFDGADAWGRAHRLVELLGAAMESSRAITWRMLPREVEGRGLVGALAHLAEQVRDAVGLDVRFEAGEQLPRLGDSDAAVIYRVAQEAITNVVRHAEASTVRLTIVREGGWLRLTVSDDGVGFDTAAPRAAEEPHATGLEGMRERASSVGAELTVDSAPGRGTTVELGVPVLEVESSRG